MLTRAVHAVVCLAALAFTGYVCWVAGRAVFYEPAVWWQSIGVWFACAVIAHDLVLFPLYALADRVHVLAGRRHHRRVTAERARRPRLPVSPTNHLRLPTMATVLCLVLFLPGIVEQGGVTYTTATGLTQEPFATRWLALSTGFFAVSGLWYLVRVIAAGRRRVPVP